MLNTSDLRRASNSWTPKSRVDSNLIQQYPESLLQTQLDLEPLLDFLAEDDRPTIIVEELDRGLRVVFSNIAFRRLLDRSQDSESLEEWLDGIYTSSNVGEESSNFGGRTWHSKQLRHRWRIIQSRQTSEVSLDPSGTDSSTPSQASTWGDIIEGGRKLIDWTRDADVPPNTWTQFIKNYDWGTTQLGARENWPEELRRLAVLIMACPDPRMIYWGNHQAILYNEAAALIVGDRHPGILGRKFVEVWGEQIYRRHMELVKDAIFEGKSYQTNEFEAVLERAGRMEETYWNIHLLPVPGPQGHIIAAVNEYTESTSAVFHEQRRKLLARISEHTSLSENLHDLWQTFLADLGDNLDDVLFVMIYTAEAGSQEQYALEGSVGLDKYPVAQSVNMADTSLEPSIANALRHAHEAHHVIKLTKRDDLPANLALDIPERGTVDTACILPISSMNGQQLAFVVLGLNPRRPFTEETGLFVTHIRDLVSKFAAIISLPEEQKRDQAKFEQLNLALTQQLRITALKAEKNEETFMRMARNAPFGMYMVLPTGEPKFVNDGYLEVLSMTREEYDQAANTGVAWRDAVYHEDVELVNDMWARTSSAKTPSKHEFRVNARPNPSEEGPGFKWVENLSFPELNEEGEVVSVLGWLHDISHRKITEALLAQRLEDALENKRASERFIDMTSHEMRNPLSAILQLADEISTSMPPPPRASTTISITTQTAETILDAAQTILLCAQHQKNIVDDVLTISKLDSNLLVITPDKVSPTNLIRKALKMYEAELVHASIGADIEVQRTYLDLNITTVMLDPSRLLQVVINLLTNAIKFTKDLPNRHISIILSASQMPPTGEDFGITFAAPRQKHSTTPKSTSAEWGAGEEVYIQITVKDTGKGLTKDEMELLFHRFQQGNPRTYKQYGGSGLGLFISKELTELQGGQIGAQSCAGVGSTFAFFVKARRCADLEREQAPSWPNALKRRRASNSNGISHPMGTMTDMKLSSEKSQVANLHVLVVEDNAINQRVMAQQLRRMGCAVATADHGLDALSYLTTTSFYRASADQPLSVILMDLEMPVMDGLTCISRIRQFERTGEILGHVPVIAITANARSEQIDTALKAGMDEVVTKPFTIRDLLPRMQALVSKLSD